jgi:hypothetical protein
MQIALKTDYTVVVVTVAVAGVSDGPGRKRSSENGTPSWKCQHTPKQKKCQRLQHENVAG